jgi:hypothetical protein
MAQDPEHGSRKHIRRRGRTDWEPVDIPLAYANWTRDGEAIIGFDSVASRAVRFSLKTRTSTPLADLPPLVVLLGVPWMGLDAEDSPIVLREHGVWDLYEIELATGGRGW